MSIWTSLRDSVETEVAGAINNSGIGLTITPDMAVTTAAPAGVVGAGGVPNKNPTVASKGMFGAQNLFLWGAGFLLLIFLLKMKR